MLLLLAALLFIQASKTTSNLCETVDGLECVFPFIKIDDPFQQNVHQYSGCAQMRHENEEKFFCPTKSNRLREIWPLKSHETFGLCNQNCSLDCGPKMFLNCDGKCEFLDEIDEENVVELPPINSDPTDIRPPPIPFPFPPPEFSPVPPPPPFEFSRKKRQTDEDLKWVCDGRCQHLSEPCNKKCPRGTKKFRNYDCKINKCVSKAEWTLCNGQCQRQCDDNIKCPSDTWKCQGKCIAKTQICINECYGNRFPDCNGKNCRLLDYLTFSDTEVNFIQEDFWQCESECQSVRIPCKNQCPDTLRLCGNRCIERDRICGNGIFDCQFVDFFPNCNGKCVKGPLRNYLCDGKCIKETRPCHGQCPPWMRLCHGQCINGTLSCDNTCDGKRVLCPTNTSTCLETSDFSSMDICLVWGDAQNTQDGIFPLAAGDLLPFCPDVFAHSRKLCESPNWLQMKDRCVKDTKYPLQTESFPRCKGHRPSQCLYDENLICNGVYDCIDRSDEENCETSKNALMSLILDGDKCNHTKG